VEESKPRNPSKSTKFQKEKDYRKEKLLFFALQEKRKARIDLASKIDKKCI